jgi:hypothetical protein
MGNEEIIIDEEGFKNLENKMEELGRRIKAKAILLVDKNGFLILSKGRFPKQPPEDIGVMASAAFTALNQMLNHDSELITVDFHCQPEEIVQCHILHQKMFLVLLFQPPVRDNPEWEGRIRTTAQSFMKEINRIFFP